MKKIFSTLVISIVIALILIVFLIYPLFTEIKKNSEELLSQKKKLILLTKEGENLKKIADTYKNYQSDLDKIENLLFDPEIPMEFINFLEMAAQTSGVELEISAMTKRVEKGDPWSSLSLQTSVTGSFPNFLKFLEKLENSSYLIEILNLNTSRLTETDTRTSLSIKAFTQ